MPSAQPGPSAAAAASTAASLRLHASSLPEDRYSILGVDVSLRTDSPPVRSFFSHAYRWFPPAGSGRLLPLTALVGSDAPAPPCASAGEAWIDLSRSRSPENRAFLFLLESIMDAISESVVLHGAAVSLDGRGTILAGPALAGKSTLALELMNLGHAFLSDDAAPLERSSGLLLPFPRAVGVRKSPKAAALPASGVLDLPHKWLVDPAALGAALPASPCRPRSLFYLDGGEDGRDGGDGGRSFDVAVADSPEEIREALLELKPESLRTAEEGPFPVLTARFGKGARPLFDLAALWRRHRDAVLFIEETRPPARRREGAPMIRAVEFSSLLLPLVRDILNRGEEGSLMTSHSGRLTSLVVELAKLLSSVRCYRVVSGTPARSAKAIDKIVRERKSGV